MAVSRLKNWIAAETLSASDLNAEFNNILTNGEDLGWPATKDKATTGTFKIDGDLVRAGPLLQTEQPTTSGTEIDFTSVPSWVKKITIMWAAVSTSGTSTMTVQLKGSGGFVTSGYLGASGLRDAGPSYTANTTGFRLADSWDGAWVITGVMSLYLEDATNNVWLSHHDIAREDIALMIGGAGRLSLGSTLTEIRITTTGGSNTFDTGGLNVMYE